jgi:hypothetical protein
MQDRVFTGDTLMIRGTGRTDFQDRDPVRSTNRCSAACCDCRMRFWCFPRTAIAIGATPSGDGSPHLRRTSGLWLGQLWYREACGWLTVVVALPHHGVSGFNVTAIAVAVEQWRGVPLFRHTATQFRKSLWRARKMQT